MTKSVVIIGTGLMGGSLGLALRQRDPSIEVVGVDAPEVLDVAVARGAISRGVVDAKEAVRDAAIVFIAAPPAVSLEVLADIAPHLPSGAVVSDMCSVKQPIARIAREVLSSSVLFVGGHPMTGSERNGIRHAETLLFENATYVLCPLEDAHAVHAAGYETLKQTLALTGARLIELEAGKHDRIAARVSHLPQLLSVLLVNLAGATRREDPEVLSLAAGGFRDMTRIASSSYDMWREILDGNKLEILAALDHMERQLQELKLHIEKGEQDYVRQQFRDAEQTRDFIPTDRKGFLKPLSDVFVFASDRPGALVGITGSLFEAELNIKDIELLRIREGTGGTFRLGFHTPLDADRAVEVLEKRGFSAYRL